MHVIELTILSLEHPEVEVVAVNDPFIEPKYAVRCPCFAPPA
jgi:hypothetical protein